MSNIINSRLSTIESAVKNNNRDNPWQEFLLAPLYEEYSGITGATNGYYQKLKSIGINLLELPLNTSNCINFFAVFFNSDITNSPNWDLSNGINLNSMFNNCQFTSFSFKDNDLKKAGDIRGFFSNCVFLTTINNLNLTNLNLDYEGTNGFLEGCTSLTKLTNFTCASRNNVTYRDNMFEEDGYSILELDIEFKEGMKFTDTSYWTSFKINQDTLDRIIDCLEENDTANKSFTIDINCISSFMDDDKKEFYQEKFEEKNWTLIIEEEAE